MEEEEFELVQEVRTNNANCLPEGRYHLAPITKCTTCTTKLQVKTNSPELRRRNTARMGFSVDVWWGTLSAEGKKLDRCSKVIIGLPVSIPSALVKP